MTSREVQAGKHSIFIIFNRSNSNYNKTHVFDKIESSSISFESFQNLILKNIDLRNKETNQTSNKKNNDLLDLVEEDINKLSNAELMEHQKRELEKLEVEALKKKRDEEKRIEEEKKKKEEEKRKEEELKKKQELNKSALSSEPEEGENTALVIFRYPHSEQRAQRRFLKSDKIDMLYTFVRSLGNDIFEDSGEFELITPFPFKVFSDKNKTLEEEKLFPNAILQIRESE